MNCKIFQAQNLLATVVAFAIVIRGNPVDNEVPPEMTKCIQTLTERTNNSAAYTVSFSEEIHTICLQEFMWKFGNTEWKNLNITEDDRRYINSLIGSLVYQTRERRQAGGLFGRPYTTEPRPQTGFKVRKEYRRLTDRERGLFHQTLQRMKRSGRYDTFANIHSGTNVNSAHNGPNFPGWHRVYLALFEEAMRQASPGTSVTLPYWDSTLDFDMTNPANSIIWSVPFLGNGDGQVTTGPFANWMTNSLQLTRNVGGASTLFSKEIINRILTRCRNSQILTPTAQPNYDFEFFHGGPHVWVGGQMAFLNSAAHDPVFFMHHAYVDYVWEQFRQRQRRRCRVNPETDYPETQINLHVSNRTMDGFPNYRNIDGYRDYWTRYWYRYESAPTCTRFRSSCGSPYLRCDVQRQRCVSVERRTTTVLTPAGAGTVISQAAAIPARTTFQAAQAQESRISGAKFRAPPSEPRTAEAQLRSG